MNIAISVTVHENYLVVIDQIRNFCHFIKNPIIVIHVNKNCDTLYWEIKNALEDIRRDICHNIFITEDRVHTGKDDYSLDNAHINNYYFLINNNIKFDYFLLEASNSLFIRYGVEECLSKYDAGNFLRVIQENNTEYWTPKVYSHETYTLFSQKMLPNEGKIYKSMHEGSFYKAEIAGKIMQIVKNMREICVLFNDYPTYPTEEFWFSLALKKVINEYGELKIRSPLTYMPWNRNLLWSIDDVNIFLNDPKDFFSIKRIERKYDDDVRSFIRDKFGY